MMLSDAEKTLLIGGNAMFNAQTEGRQIRFRLAQPLIAQNAQRRAALDEEFGLRYAAIERERAALDEEYGRRRAEIEQFAQAIVPGIAGPAKGPGSQGRPF